ncbi:MAG: FAD:protein FMN transferase [Planctomycetaceae bacterium]|nr:FAD:protein FMN transferase [Planctomycetaceae bacterium]
MTGKSQSRRDFLAPPRQSETPVVPVGGSTIHVAARAMACEFAVIMNGGSHERTMAVGDVLQLIADIETWLSVYRPHSEMTDLNNRAAGDPVRVRPPLLELLQVCQQLHAQTDGAFDVAAGAQIRMWRQARSENRMPAPGEVAEALRCSGTHHLSLHSDDSSVSFGVDGLALDPGAIGKGYALDQAAQWMDKMDECPEDYLLHGGHSSLVARGSHEGQGGWPVGIGNPLFTKKRLGTVLLRNQAMSTSGSNIQFFRHEGRRYGHILDPRTAMPVEGMLSVTVFAESAAIADALSTAFFVLGVENAQKCCDNLPNVGAILVPYPERGARVTPTIIGVPEDQIFWDDDQVTLD